MDGGPGYEVKWLAGVLTCNKSKQYQLINKTGKRRSQYTHNKRDGNNWKLYKLHVHDFLWYKRQLLVAIGWFGRPSSNSSFALRGNKPHRIMDSSFLYGKRMEVEGLLNNTMYKDSVSKENRTRQHYKNHFVNAVYENNRCLFWELHVTRVYSVRKMQSCLFLIKVGAHSITN